MSGDTYDAFTRAIAARDARIAELEAEVARLTRAVMHFGALAASAGLATVTTEAVGGLDSQHKIICWSDPTEPEDTFDFSEPEGDGPQIITGGNPPREIFVAPNGSDSNPGTREQPKRTIGAAMEGLREN